MRYIVLMSFIWLSQLSGAQTLVSGGIFANTTWSLANSPYVLTGPIVVFPGNTLTLEPGVVVKVQFKGFNTGLMSYIELRGSMQANGTLAAPIKFEAELPSTDYTWRGIEIKSKQGGTFTGSNFELNNTLYGISSDKIYYDTVTFNQCTFKHNNFGISLAGAIKLSNCTFINNGAAMASMTTFGGVDVSNCNFQNNGVCFTTLSNPINVRNSQFVGGRAAIMQCTGKVENCTFQQNESAIEYCYGLELKNCILQQNGIAILGANQSTIENNVIIANNLGLEISGPCVVTNNDINANQVGVKISGAFEPGQTIQNFNNNRLCYNTQYNVENGSDMNLGLETNCFCLQDSATIEAFIYDGYDDFTRGLINFATYDTTCTTLLTAYKKVQINTSVSQVEDASAILVYPNPANNLLTIEFLDKPNSAMLLQVFDVTGRLKLEASSNGLGFIQIDVSPLQNGVYWLKANDGSFAKCFMKN